MKRESVKKNFAYNIIYQILVLILPLVTAPYLSRVIGSDGIGVYSYTQAFANYFVLIAMLGVENYGNREIARVRDDKKKKEQIFWEIFAIQSVLTILLSGIYIVYILFAHIDHALIYGLQLFYIISAAFNINWYFWGVEKFKITVIRNAVIKVITTLCIFAFVRGKDDLWLYTIIISLGTLISNIGIWPFLLKEVKPIRISFANVKKHIKPDVILFIPVIAVSLYNVMDKIMLGSLSTYSEVGYYTYAEKIVQVPVTIIIALGTVMMPHVSNLMAKGKDEECKHLFDKAMHFVLFTGFAFTFGMASLSPVFSDWYYGNSFAKCGDFMIILTPVIIFKSWANLVRTQFIIPKGFDNVYIWSVSTGAVANLILNAILIPRYQGVGAIIGTIVAEFIVCFIQTWKTSKFIKFKPYYIETLVFALIGLIMYICMDIVKKLLSDASSFFVLIICFIIGGSVYCISSLIYVSLSKRNTWILNDIKKVVKKLLKKEKHRK